MLYEKTIIPDQRDGNILVVHPELSELKKYIKLSEENKFWIEFDICFLYENKRYIKKIKDILTIHLRNDYDSNKIDILIKDIKFALQFSPKFIILHDNVLWNIDHNVLTIINKYIKRSKTTILVENYKYSSKKYNKLYQNLLWLLPWVKKCIDWWHSILKKENIDNWIDNNVLYFHFNNNFWICDTHNSIYNWKGIISKEFIKKIHNIKYISLEINVKYKTYYNNIIYMLQNKIPPFNWLILNLPIYQKHVIFEIKNFISAKLNKDIVYSFIYWSFAKRNCHKWSDLDVFLCTKHTIDKKSFIKEYIKLCKNLWFTIDKSYPIELFSEKNVNNIVNDKKTRLVEEDIEEIKNAHLMKSIFLCWDKNKYFKNLKGFNNL